MGKLSRPTGTGSRCKTSQCALRKGGLALVAHHVDATFGDVVVQRVMPNVQPSVTLTVPTNHAVFSAPANLTLTAEGDGQRRDGDERGVLRREYVDWHGQHQPLQRGLEQRTAGNLPVDGESDG